MADYMMKFREPSEEDYDPVGRISCTNCRHTVPFREEWKEEAPLWHEMYGCASLCKAKRATTATQPNMDWCMLFATGRS